MVLIAVAGAPGTGTTTLCRLLSEALSLPHVYAGQIFRALAKERGMSLQEFSAYAEQHDDVDRELDQRMIGHARDGNVVLEGRMAAWQVREAGVSALRVLLVAPPEVRASRVAEREGEVDIDAIVRALNEREASEAKRYQAYYGFDPADRGHYDLVIDSSDKSPETIRDLVLDAVRAREAV